MFASLLNGNKRKLPTLQEFIDRGFAPAGGVTDILLIFPPTSVADRYGKADVGDAGGDLPPLGVTTIAAYLREKGFGVGLLDGCGLGLGHNQIIDIIRAKDPKAVGISSTTYALPSGLALARRIRSEFPDKLVILGGAHANAVPLESAQDYPEFDLVVYGEGELSAEQILGEYKKLGYDRTSFLEGEAFLSGVKGIVYRNAGGCVLNPEMPNIKNLDTLPLPARDLLPMEIYLPLPNQYKKPPVVHMVVIRGCPYACSFCDQAGTGGRTRSPAKAVEEIVHVVEKYGAREISFWDDTMSFNRVWMRKFCQLLIEADTGVIWSCYAAVNTVDRQLLDLMHKAGCWNIFYGIETGVPELMKNIESHRKNTSPDKIRKTMQETKDAGIEIRGSFMIALPGETPELAAETIKFAIELDPDYAQFSITTPYPGTHLYDDIKQGKWGKLTTTDFSEFQGWNVVFLPNGYKSQKEVWEMERKAFRSFYFRPKYILKKFLQTRSLEDIKRYFKGLRLLIGGFAYGPMPPHIREVEGRTPGPEARVLH
ncbi:MAG: cobalamin B12-binding domain-containing protein [Elusimicrobia bacterium]|nr:cobalamin B12-binding domain-containing protein [Elusimicrobiota bacterium]